MQSFPLEEGDDNSRYGRSDPSTVHIDLCLHAQGMLPDLIIGD